MIDWGRWLPLWFCAAIFGVIVGGLVAYGWHTLH